MAFLVMKQIIIMILIIMVGYIAFHSKLVSERGCKDLSNILMYVINPAMIFLAFQMDYEPDLMVNFGFALILGFGAIIFGIILGSLILRKKTPVQMIEKYAMAYRNIGFFGIPIIKSLYGMTGVFYLTAMMAAFNILNWSHGITLMKGGGEKFKIKEMLHNMVNPTIIATCLGFMCFIFRWMMPEVIKSTVTYIADMNTPVAMLIVGVGLASQGIRKIFTNKRVLEISALGMALIPLAFVLLVRCLPIAEEVRVTATITACCPFAATLTAFSFKFDRDANYASQLSTVSTLISLITIPMYLLLYSL